MRINDTDMSSSNFFGCSVTNRFRTFFRRHFGLISASILWISGFRFLDVDEYQFDSGRWIDIGFRFLDISALISGYWIYIGFESLALDRWISVLDSWMLDRYLEALGLGLGEFQNFKIFILGDQFWTYNKILISNFEL
ncbi:hypothetical protein RhiirC2_786913 [Rhizophagus irregularis]|uniref:Uncharacterized protein n=1 Tax=Rhizophagus irregularis TaxID=588596 RepID=A0A2N1MTB9_9GLOM|nr:hypothetical protein RhiirC2_786913 [Rhizophagus irregularis]